VAVGTTSVRVLESAYEASSGFMPGFGETDIFIYPGYKWKCVDGLITNFHLPKSSLLLLVSSFGGKIPVFMAYSEAIRLKYRFYSFGDAMLII
jgi:S-adenosylmethionine:tRNA ribosyltransferase-isomerase